MDFDDWMLSKDPKYHPSDDTVQLRRMRECWNAATLSEGNRLQIGIDQLLKGEYICKRCGLRKNDEHPRTHDF